MRIAFCLWPISQEGGLATRTLALVRNARACGHQAEFIRLAYSGHRQQREEGVHAQGDNLRAVGQRLSLEDDVLLDTLLELDSYDLLVFTHACPHVSDTQKAVSNWRRVFTDTSPHKIVYFSDAFVQDYYPWIADVADYFHPVATNDSAARQTTAFLNRPVRVARQVFAFDVKPAVYGDKSNLALWASAWRSWKGVRTFCDAVPDIRGRVELYGGGRELREFQKERPDGWPGVIFGPAQPSVIEHAYARAKVAVDLTGQSRKYHGHYNRATLEPMFYGCVMVCRSTLPDPHSYIPRHCVFTVPSNARGPQVAEAVNRLLADEPLRVAIARRAYKWVTDYHRPQRVMDELLDLVPA